MIGINPNKVHECVLPSEKGNPDHTTFYFKALKASQRAECEDLYAIQYGVDGSVEEHNVEVKLGSFYHKLIKYGFCGWKNLKNEEGKEIPYSKIGEPATENQLDILPQEAKFEIASRIISVSFANMELKKK